jgi:uncharacterized membrane protein
MKRHVYGIFADKNDAARAYQELTAKCGAERCSVIVHEAYADATADPRDMRRGAIGGAAIVGTAGAVITGLAAVGAGLLVVGPLMVAGFAVGSVYGALSGALSGIADEHADKIEARLREGKIVVAAESQSQADATLIETVLVQHHGEVPESPLDASPG